MEAVDANLPCPQASQKVDRRSRPPSDTCRAICTDLNRIYLREQVQTMEAVAQLNKVQRHRRSASKSEECPSLRAVQYELDRTESQLAPHLSQAMEAAAITAPGSQASQEVASEVEERPAMHVVQFALA